MRLGDKATLPANLLPRSGVPISPAGVLAASTTEPAQPRSGWIWRSYPTCSLSPRRNGAWRHSPTPSAICAYRRPVRPGIGDCSPLRGPARAEETRLLEACAARPVKWLAPLVRLALATGMRQGELLALEWPNINLDGQVAHLPDTKNGEGRDVPLSTAALQAIKDMVPQQEAGTESELPTAGRVFPVRDDKVRREFPKACKAAGITGLRFHDLRHEATSRLFEKGLNPMEAASVTGHKTLQMLKRYTHLRAEDLAKRLG